MNNAGDLQQQIQQQLQHLSVGNSRSSREESQKKAFTVPFSCFSFFFMIKHTQSCKQHNVTTHTEEREKREREKKEKKEIEKGTTGVGKAAL